MENKKPLSIIKIGGNIIDNPTELAQFLSDFSNIGGYKILVHGGGKSATKMAQSIDDDVMRKVSMKINSGSLAQLNSTQSKGLIKK